MLLNHIAAILFFSGPLFYVGLLLLIDPVGIAALPVLLARALRNFHRALGGLPAEAEPETAGPSHRRRKSLRLAGLALVVCGLLVGLVA